MTFRDGASAPAWLVSLVRLTRREYFADFWITPPITAALAVYSVTHHFGPWWLPLAAAGALAWTLYEYVVHLASHHLPWLVDLHRLHHRNQKDYIALHPALTLTIYAVIWLIFGFSAASRSGSRQATSSTPRSTPPSTTPTSSRVTGSGR